MSSMFKSCEEFVDGVRTKRVTNFRPIERDTDRAVLNRSMVGDICEFESGDDAPGRWIEDVRNFAFAHGLILSDEKAKHPLLAARWQPKGGVFQMY